MKISVQKNSESKVYQVEIPATVDLNYLSNGELFPVYLLDQKGGSKKVNACLLADRRSFLIENKIVRFNAAFVIKKNERYFSDFFLYFYLIFRYHLEINPPEPIFFCVFKQL